MTRPQSEINWEYVDKLLEAGCDGTEVAGRLGIHPDTLYKRTEEKYNTGFSAYLQSKRAHGNACLRLHQFEKALGLTKKGDTQLLMRLGEERLGQKQAKEIATGIQVKLNDQPWPNDNNNNPT